MIKENFLIGSSLQAMTRFCTSKLQEMPRNRQGFVHLKYSEPFYLVLTQHIKTGG